MSLHSINLRQPNQRLFSQTNNKPHTISDKKYSSIYVERMWLCVAIKLQDGTHCRSSQNSSRFFQSGKKVTEKVPVKIFGDIQTLPIEVSTSFLHVADAEHIFFTTEEHEAQAKKNNSHRKHGISKTCCPTGSVFGTNFMRNKCQRP